ncbi:MAG: hypothetical protein M0Z52_01055 [Actinomycetota bacterium]|nr:hypothetical protein [Actinomycetota bacterium]
MKYPALLVLVCVLSACGAKDPGNPLNIPQNEIVWSGDADANAVLQSETDAIRACLQNLGNNPQGGYPHVIVTNADIPCGSEAPSVGGCTDGNVIYVSDFLPEKYGEPWYYSMEVTDWADTDFSDSDQAHQICGQIDRYSPPLFP